MYDGFIMPDHFDGMGCNGREGGRMALMRNHEIGVRHDIPGVTGGTTPWGSWLSHEEIVEKHPARGQSHGRVFEVPADQPGLAAAVPLKAMGCFRHETGDRRPGLRQQGYEALTM